MVFVCSFGFVFGIPVMQERHAQIEVEEKRLAARRAEVLQLDTQLKSNRTSLEQKRDVFIQEQTAQQTMLEREMQKTAREKNDLTRLRDNFDKLKENAGPEIARIATEREGLNKSLKILEEKQAKYERDAAQLTAASSALAKERELGRVVI